MRGCEERREKRDQGCSNVYAYEGVKREDRAAYLSTDEPQGPVIFSFAVLDQVFRNVIAVLRTSRKTIFRPTVSLLMLCSSVSA